MAEWWQLCKFLWKSSICPVRLKAAFGPFAGRAGRAPGEPLYCVRVVLRMNWASFIGACALTAAAGSLASDRIFAEGAGGVMSDRVQIELRGTITPQCAFQNIASSLDLGTIPDSGASGEKKLDFQISCNTPFAYGLSSDDGAMRRDAGAEGMGGFLTQFPYQAALTIHTDDGATL